MIKYLRREEEIKGEDAASQGKEREEGHPTYLGNLYRCV